MREIIKAINSLFVRREKKTINQTNIIVFGEWFGKKCCDNCLSFANYLANEKTPFELYWVMNKECDTSRLDKRIKLIERGSEEAIRVLQRARIIIVNQGIVDVIPDTSYYPCNSVLINFWHGVAWKKIGSDSLKNRLKALYSRHLYRNDGTDYYLTTSAEFTRRLKTAFAADEKKTIKAGYPRNSLFYDVASMKRLRDSFITKHALENNAIFVSYLPTFRDKTESVFDIATILKDKSFSDYLASNEVYLIRKDHFVTEQRDSFHNSIKTGRIIIDESISASETLAISDVLITDYSSCFFDYLVLNRPIIHFLYDYDYYKTSDRGLYYDINDVSCGRCCFSDEELKKEIRYYIENPSSDEDVRKNRKQLFMEYETPKTNEAILSFIQKNLGIVNR